MLPDGLVIDDEERELAVVALKIVEREFARDWGEFCTVIPGELDWYPLNADDLGRLRCKMEKAL